MSECGCIYEYVGEFLETVDERIVKATVPTVCGECDDPIVVGEKYEYYEGSDYDIDVFAQRTCLDCLSVRDEFFCDGFFFGRIWDRVKDHIYDTSGKISSDCLLRLTPGARERIIDLIDEDWEESDE
jgi:hypothetical protein